MRIPTGGHFIQGDEAEQLAREIKAFFKREPRGGCCGLQKGMILLQIFADKYIHNFFMAMS